MSALSKFKGIFFPHDKKADHFKALDGLRGIAVLFVLLSHTSNDKLYFSNFLNFANTGKLGVYLFFLLSAYLLDRQIAAALISGKSSWQYWKNYFLRRFLRIYPLFLVSLIIHYALTKSGIKTKISSLSDIPMHLILIKGSTIFWSIAVEFKYYFISPLIMIFCDRVLKWDKVKTLGFLFAIIAASIGIQFVKHFSNTSTTNYLPIFLTGTIISIYEVVYLKKGDVASAGINKNFVDVLGSAAFILIIISIPYYFSQLFHFSINFKNWKFYFPYALAWGAFLIAAKYGRVVRGMMEFNFFRFIGTISFSVYLFHMPVLLLLEPATSIPENIKIYLFFAITICVSVITYLLVERPLSKIYLTSKKVVPAPTAKVPG